MDGPGASSPQPSSTPESDAVEDDEQGSEELAIVQRTVKEAKHDPNALVGWRVEVLGKGTGVVKRTEGGKKNPKHVLDMDEGSEETVTLDLVGDGKGSAYFLKDKVK